MKLRVAVRWHPVRDLLQRGGPDADDVDDEPHRLPGKRVIGVDGEAGDLSSDDYPIARTSRPPGVCCAAQIFLDTGYVQA